MEFPNWGPFPHLVKSASEKPHRMVMRDLNAGVELTLSQTLDAAISVRDHLLSVLPEEISKKLQHGQEDVPFVLLIPAGWEMIVTILAIWSLGGAVMPISPSILPEEARYFISTSKAEIMLYNSSTKEQATSVSEHYLKDATKSLLPVGLSISLTQTSSERSYPVRTTSNPPSRAAVIFYTSGTTGRPKGVVQTFAAYQTITNIFNTYNMPMPKQLWSLYRAPAHWIGGFTGMINCLISLQAIEFCSSVWSSEWFWERIKQGNVSVVSFLPSQLDPVAEYYEKHLMGLPEEEKSKYLAAIKSVRMMVSGAPMQPKTQRYWTQLRDGEPLFAAWGSTETSVGFWLAKKSKPDDYIVNEVCTVGHLAPCAEAKISEDGELLLKTPWMFSRYLVENEDAIKDALTPDGFFRTGDLAAKVGDFYFILGRASVDSIRFAGYKLFASDPESALEKLPYVSSAIVLGLDDETCHQRVAAVISPKPGLRQPNLVRLREDLANQTKLERFKFPTAVYWLDESESLPMTGTGKVSKVAAKGKFFGTEWKENERVELFDLSTLKIDLSAAKAEQNLRPWDWGGIAK